MKQILHRKVVLIVAVLLLFTAAFAQEMEVEGDLKVTGNIIFNDASIQGTAAAPSAPGMNGVAEFTSTTTWTIPDGITKIRVQVIGGGGSGGNNRLVAQVNYNGSGGGAGAYVHSVITVVPGSILNINVGSGGIATESAFTPGNDGTASSIIDENGITMVIANGGFGGPSLDNYSANGGTGEHTGVGIVYNGNSNIDQYGNPTVNGAIRDKTFFGAEYGFGGRGSYPHGSNDFGYPATSGGNGYIFLLW